MENSWICKKCSEEVDSSFEICWNCNSDRNGSISTFEEIKRENDKIEQELKNITFEDQMIVNINNIQIAGHKIVAAGRNLKSIIYLLLIMIVLIIISTVIVNYTEKLDTIKNIYFIMGIIGFVCHVIIFYQIYSAGDNLENSIYKQKREN